jgi:hypothetical protein
MNSNSIQQLSSPLRSAPTVQINTKLDQSFTNSYDMNSKIEISNNILLLILNINKKEKKIEVEYIIKYRLKIKFDPSHCGHIVELSRM